MEAVIVRWRSTAGVILALMMFEVLLRHLAVGHQSLDPQTGWVWRSVKVVHRLNEGWGVSHWNAEGARAHPPARAGAPRVLVVGDSFTEALQVGDDEVYTGRMRGVDAANVGRASHSAPDYVAFASDYQTRFTPAWTVIEVGPPDFAEDAFNTSKTHFDAELNVVLVPPHFGGISQLLMFLRDRSALLNSSIARWQMYDTAKMPPLFRASEAGSVRASAAPEPPVAWPVAAEMGLLLRAYHGRVTFLFIPPFGERDAVETQFLATCARNGLSCVDLRASFAEFRARGEAPFGFPNSRFGIGHMNAAGHAAAARLLNAELERLRERGLF